MCHLKEIREKEIIQSCLQGFYPECAYIWMTCHCSYYHSYFDTDNENVFDKINLKLLDLCFAHVNLKSEQLTQRGDSKRREPETVTCLHYDDKAEPKPC